MGRNSGWKRKKIKSVQKWDIVKIFIAGGTGVLGTRLVPLLVEDGHDVTILARSKENKNKIEQMGGKAVEGSIFDLNSLIKATKGMEYILHLATAIPQKAKTKPKDWELNSRIRIEGGRNLMEAASKNEAMKYIQQSVTFAYGNRIDQVDDTFKPTLPIPTKIKLPPQWQEVMDNPIHMEKMIENKSEELNLPYTILRFGWFYSHDSTNIRDVYEGNFAHIWKQNPFWSMIHVNDAVSAILAVLEKTEQTENQTFNVVDSNPVHSREFLEHARQLFGKGPLRKVPGFLVQLLFGPYALNFLTSSLRVSNRNFKQKTGWKPRFATYKEGLREAVEKFLENLH